MIAGVPRLNPMSDSALGRMLGVAGVVVVAIALWASRDRVPAWALVLAAAALAAWLAAELLPRQRAMAPFVVLLLGMAAAGSVALLPSQVLAGVPVVVALVALVARRELPIWLGLAVASAGLAVCAAMAVALRPPLGVMLGALAVYAVSVLIGVARRQSALARERERELAAGRLEAERERARSAALDERARIARELHDVLAHSLGGLVVQLDALDALAAAGRADALPARIRQARSLAVDGLAEARDAVAALRDPDAGPVPLAELAAEVERLVAAERGIGGRIDATLDGLDDPDAAVPPVVAEAFRRAVQEGLSNARKHAPGEPVRVELRGRAGEAGELVLVMSNPVSASVAASGTVAPRSLAASGAGRGLAGMRERFSALPGGEVSVQHDAVSFELRARAALR